MVDENKNTNGTKDSFNPTKKKVLENRLASGLVVPLAIVLVGALVVFGVTQMLSTGRSYKDVVKEMQSKTFGNRWVAAYELSKLVNSKTIPDDEIPWLVENLGVIYDGTIDQRTRNFVIITFGALKSKQVLPYLFKALNDEDMHVQFSALVALGNFPNGSSIDWSPVMKMTQSEDPGIRQAALFALAAQKVPGSEYVIEPLLADGNISVKYAAATALVAYKSKRALPTIKEIFEIKTSKDFNAQKLQDLQLNLIAAIGREKWMGTIPLLEQLVNTGENDRVKTSARQALNLLKN